MPSKALARRLFLTRIVAVLQATVTVIVNETFLATMPLHARAGREGRRRIVSRMRLTCFFLSYVLSPFLSLLVRFLAPPKQRAAPLFWTPPKPIDARVDDLIKRMTLEQKAHNW